MAVFQQIVETLCNTNLPHPRVCSDREALSRFASPLRQRRHRHPPWKSWSGTVQRRPTCGCRSPIFCPKMS